MLESLWLQPMADKAVMFSKSCSVNESCNEEGPSCLQCGPAYFHIQSLGLCMSFPTHARANQEESSLPMFPPIRICHSSSLPPTLLRPPLPPHKPCHSFY